MSPLRQFAAAVLLGLACAAPVRAATWVADKAASHVGFTGVMNGAAFHGVFHKWDTEISFDPANLAASHVVAKIETGSALTGDQTRDEAMPTADWFAAKAFPTAVFRSRRIVAAGAGRYVAEGDLTIRQATRSVSLPFALTIAGDAAKMTGALTLDRALFGVGQGQWRTGEAVALAVQVDIAVAARKAHGEH